MKFSLPFKLSREGISISYKGDTLTYSWIPFFWGEVHSKYTGLTYAEFKYYKKHISDIEKQGFKKLLGFDYLDIISQWISLKFPVDHIIILLNINVEAKNVQFWAKIPQTEIGHFLKDTVVLRCKDESEMERLVSNIPPNFAEAYGYSCGNLITYNKEDYE